MCLKASECSESQVSTSCALVRAKMLIKAPSQNRCRSKARHPKTRATYAFLFPSSSSRPSKLPQQQTAEWLRNRQRRSKAPVTHHLGSFSVTPYASHFHSQLASSKHAQPYSFPLPSVPNHAQQSDQTTPSSSRTSRGSGRHPIGLWRSCRG
jgi:hypothetical protein